MDSLPDEQDFSCGECEKWIDKQGCSLEPTNTHRISDIACNNGAKRGEPIIANTGEPAREDLEKEFNRFLDEIGGTPRMYHSEEQIEWGKDIAHHFADWQKQQMMKEALDGEICIPNAFSTLEEEGCLIARAKVPVGGRFKFGDKVKVIIVKED